MSPRRVRFGHSDFAHSLRISRPICGALARGPSARLIVWMGTRFLLGPLLALLFAIAPAAVRAQVPEQPSARDLVVAQNVGLRLAIAPGVYIPTDGGSVGFSIVGDVRFGIELGPIIVAPGGRLAGYFPSGLTILAALATGRVTVPLGPVGPYVMGGLGPGWVSDPAKAGLAWMAGGGLMANIGPHFALGAEVTYQGITGTAVKALFIGPTFLFGF